jgi:hypothetical protein
MNLELLSIAYSPDSHPAERKLALEELQAKGVETNPIILITTPTGCRRSGDYSYEFGINKRVIKREPILIRLPNGEIYEERDDIVMITAVCNIIHKGKPVSSRTIIRRKGKYCYSDRRLNGKGSGLSRSEFVSSFPQQDMGELVTGSLESLLGPKKKAKVDGSLQELIDQTKQLESMLAALMALQGKANPA